MATRARSPPPSARRNSTRGGAFVFLFTDLSNPTSNKIYQAIGYEPVIDVDQITFVPADPG